MMVPIRRRVGSICHLCVVEINAIHAEHMSEMYSEAQIELMQGIYLHCVMVGEALLLLLLMSLS